jgi:endonuclease/exonuclease/phosphatase family metal-dependent hydrolase
VEALWESMVAVLGGELARSLLKVSRVVQRHDRSVRVDLFVRAGDAEAVVTRLRVARYQWRARLHLAWGAAPRAERRAARVERAVAAEGAGAGADAAEEAARAHQVVRLATWNVLSMAREVDEVGGFVRRAGVGILALQETRRTGVAYPLAIRGMAVFESRASNATGARGLALCVSRELPATLVASHAHRQWVRVAALLPGDHPLYVCNVYCKKGVDVLSAVGKEAADYVVGGAEVVILGDFNCPAAKAVRRLAAAGFAGSAVRVSSGSAATFHGRGRWSSSIDHVVASSLAHSCIAELVVDRQESRSDHWPVVAKMVVPAGAAPDAGAPAPRRGTARLEAAGAIQAFLSNNRFAALAADDADPTEVAVGFPEALQESLEEVGAFAADKRAGARRYGDRRRLGQVRKAAGACGAKLSGRARRAVEERNAAFAELRRAPAEEAPACWAKYVELRAAATATIADEADGRVAAAVRRRVKMLQERPFGGRDYWRSLKALRASAAGDAGNDAPAVGGVPIRDQKGDLVFDEAGAATVWRHHFVSLIGTDNRPEPHDTGAMYLGKQHRATLRAVDGSDLGEPFSTAELLGALRALKAHKAAGPDDVPVEILQLADPGGDATNTFGRALLAACNAVFTGAAPLDQAVLDSEVAAASWHTVKLRAVAKKGGDATLPTAYRGIGIQSAVARLLAMLVLRRLAPAAEQAGLLSRSQAGFRSREEAVAQAATLLEVCGRRRAEGKRTYLLFVDFAAAYDSVPHDYLVLKLAVLGIRGRMFHFIRRSLMRSLARPVVGNITGEEFGVKRGLIQGCPLSPLLFNLFINDLFEGAKGVVVPQADMRPADLKYADDVVALSATAAGLRKHIADVAEWCRVHDMRLNAAKCGVMAIGATDQDSERLLADMQGRPEQWCLPEGGAQLPVVATYRYLGIQVNNKLNAAEMVRARAAAGQAVLGTLMPVLRDRRIPRHERVTIVKSFLAPVVMFGAELWGGRRELVRPLHKVLHTALCVAVGVPRNTSMYCVRQTVGCRSARAWSLVASVRALSKWRGLRSWVSDLVRAPYRGRGRSWVWSRAVTRTVRRVDRSRRAMAAAQEGDISKAKKEIGKVAEVKDDTLAGRRWRQYDLDGSVAEARKLATLGAMRDLDNWTVRQLDRMRAGVFNTTQRLARCEIVAAQWRAQCPYCLQPVAEDLAHFLLDCEAWTSQRKQFIMPVLRAAGCASWLDTPERRLDLVYILLGGKARRRQAVSMARPVRPRPARDVIGHVAPMADPVANKSFRSSGANWLVGMGRFLRALWPVRDALGPPRSQIRFGGGMAELVAPGGLPAG